MNNFVSTPVIARDNGGRKCLGVYALQIAN